MLVDKELVDAQILDLTSVVLLWILDLVLEEDVTYKIGQSPHNTLTDMIEYSKTNANRHIVGNSMICQVPINV